MLKIGVLGAGHLGKIHIKCIKQIANYHLVGFYDVDPETANKVSEEFGITSFSSIEDLVDAVDVVDIVTPTISHFECASKALRKAKHVFIEKPIVASPSEAQRLLAIAKEADVKVQVGHVERFNPAFLAAEPYLENPMFIEVHRLAQFNPRGTDVPVILDLMIHDIDIILHVVGRSIRKIHASGVPVVSDTADIANARIEFDNGCVANLTASRISMKNMRKTRFFQTDSYVAVDFLDKKVEVIRMKEQQGDVEDPYALSFSPGNNKPAKQILFDYPVVMPLNAIQKELSMFAEAIINDVQPPVTIEDGIFALEVVHQILDKVNFSLGRL
ncbi:MAG: oxidoreductase [Bacteroidetes bacterium]|nr:MAG: oxidoreductase [Bacteroidota bacterium]PIE88124.1 MAG: oxidoreductase [Bacteroidota bacterium]